MSLNEQQRKRFIELMAALASSFGREADQAMLLGYRLALGDLPLEKIESAVGRAIRELKFMPSPAEVRELAGVLTPQNRAGLAWVAFTRAASRVGEYRTVDFDDRLINATVYNLGGWVPCIDRLGEPKGDQFLRKDFERIYMGLLINPPPASWLSPLLGISAQQNAGTSIPKGLEQACGLQPVLVSTDLPALPHIEEMRRGLGHSQPRRERLANEPLAIGEVITEAAGALE